MGKYIWLNEGEGKTVQEIRLRGTHPVSASVPGTYQCSKCSRANFASNKSEIPISNLAVRMVATMKGIFLFWFDFIAS